MAFGCDAAGNLVLNLAWGHDAVPVWRRAELRSFLQTQWAKGLEQHDLLVAAGEPLALDELLRSLESEFLMLSLQYFLHPILQRPWPPDQLTQLDLEMEAIEQEPQALAGAIRESFLPVFQAVLEEEAGKEARA